MKTLNILGAISAPSPVTHYNPQDFSVDYTTVSGITVVGAPFTVDNSECRVIYIKYKASTEAKWKNPLVNGMDGVTIDATSDVINVGGIAEPFSSGDEYEVGILYQKKGYSSSVDAEKVIILNPLNEQHSYETAANITNETDASSDYYVSLEGYTHCQVQYKIVGGSDVLGLTVHGTIQGDEVASSCEFENITADGMSILTHSTTSGIYDSDTILKTVEGSSWKYLKLNIASSLGSSDGDYKIFVHKWY
ncbi:MAG: hypothetical protein KAS32_21775 [Candidatus Peribacteraceae bacterium]|nr:hypothetical protein [Candidatus Peribacteraceae bacterium]